MKIARTDRVGQIFTTNEGYNIEIVEYIKHNNISIRFDDGLILKGNQISPIVNGSIKNPHHLSVCGKGYIGVGKYKTKVKGVLQYNYQLWVNVLKRVYSEAYHKRFPTYIGLSLHKEWHNFQIFAEWVENNYVEGWHLDKDIICSDCREYSPKTCVFLPHEVNTIITINKKERGNLPIGVSKSSERFIAQINYADGRPHNLGRYNTAEEAFQVYKEAKERHIKKIADKWESSLDKRVYEFLYNYNVKIND